MIVFENRASVILYNVLISLNRKGKFLLPLNVCPIVPLTFIKAKVDFEFVDIQLDNLCIDQKLVVDKVKKEEIIGVLFVHTFGIELELKTFFQSIKNIDSNIFIIDDRCLCIPEFDIDVEEDNADLILYSTGYAKYVELQWGGYGFLKSKYIYEQQSLIYKEKELILLNNNLQKSIDKKEKFSFDINVDWLGSDKKLYNNFEKYKNEISIKIKEIKKQKKFINSIYEDKIPKKFHLGKEYNNWRFSILVKNKEKILEEIFNNNLFASSHYKEVDFLFFDDFKRQSNANRISSNIINLFNDFRFTEEMAHQIVKIVNNNLKDEL